VQVPRLRPGSAMKHCYQTPAIRELSCKERVDAAQTEIRRVLAIYGVDLFAEGEWSIKCQEQDDSDAVVFEK
jgi:hypothetical protein